MNMGRKIAAVVAVVALAVAVFYVLERRSGGKEEPRRGLQEVAEETRSVTLYFGRRDAEGLVTETRQVPVREGLGNEVKAVISPPPAWTQ